MLMEPQHEIDDGEFNFACGIKQLVTEGQSIHSGFLRNFIRRFSCKIITTSRHIGATGNHNKLTTNQNIVNDSLRQ